MIDRQFKEGDLVFWVTTGGGIYAGGTLKVRHTICPDCGEEKHLSKFYRGGKKQSNCDSCAKKSKKD